MKFEGFSTENKQMVQTISTSAKTLVSDIFETHKDRLSSRGGHFTNEQLIPVYFAGLVGVPDDSDMAAFNNMLFKLRDDLIKCPKLLIYIENELKNPTAAEISFFDSVSKGNTEEMRKDFISLIKIVGDEVRTKLAVKIYTEFTDKMLTGSDTVLFDYSVSLLSWMYRCVSSDAYRNSLAEIPTLLYYGNISEAGLNFLHFMSRIGIDVIYISSEKSMFEMLKKNNLEGRMQVFDNPFSKPNSPYPNKLVKAKFATVAYNAEKELNTIFYDNTAVFRDFQFSKMHSRTLKTTYEEIDIMWHQPAKVRSGFEVRSNSVFIPNLFVKICGVKDKDLGDYWENVKYKLSPNTLIIKKAPSYDKTDFSRLNVYNQFISGGQILINELKSSKYNNYSYLSDELQYLIFEKMQEAIDSGYLNLNPSEIIQLVMYVGLNIDKTFLRILQKFDFTKDIPKIVLIDVIEDTFSRIECIQLVLYNLLGFDIAIYTPTGYRNLETYINETAYETYTMNEFLYNVNIPKLKIPDSIPDSLPYSDNGILNKLFKKSKK